MSESASIIRVKKDARYFVASNVPFNDKRLTWEARGMMGYLLSKPDDWTVRMDDLINQGPASIRVIKRVMAELKKYGYITRQLYKTADGKFHWNTTIYETPELNTTTGTERIDGTIGTICIDGKRTDIVSTESLNTRARAKEKIVKSANATIDAILDNERMAGTSWQGREKLPPAIRDLADEFVNLTAIKPAKKELMWWMGEISDWLTFGVKKADIKDAIDYAKSHDFAVMSPASLTKTARMIAAKRKTTPPAIPAPLEPEPVKAAIPYSQWKAQQVNV